MTGAERQEQFRSARPTPRSTMQTDAGPVAVTGSHPLSRWPLSGRPSAERACHLRWASSQAGNRVCAHGIGWSCWLAAPDGELGWLARDRPGCGEGRAQPLPARASPEAAAGPRPGDAMATAADPDQQQPAPAEPEKLAHAEQLRPGDRAQAKRLRAVEPAAVVDPHRPHGPIMDACTVAASQPGSDAGLRRCEVPRFPGGFRTWSTWTKKGPFDGSTPHLPTRAEGASAAAVALVDAPAADRPRRP
jgi:hypothetical protein